MENIIAQGAEAIILLDKNTNTIIKKRIKKTYRIPELDEKLRKSRTKKEAKLIEKAGKITNTPKIIKQEKPDKFSIQIGYIKGEKLSESLNLYSEEKQLTIMQKLGKQISKLHKNDIIHGDLTTSNLILKNNKPYIIDFGLGFISNRIEDKAVDLHLIKQALEAKHFQNYEGLFKAFLKTYKNKEVVERLKKVESRGRYKH